LYFFHYSKVISIIMSAAVLAGLQNAMTAMPARGETSCQLHALAAGAHRHWRRTRAANAERCAVRASGTALDSNQAAFEDART
jgi:hypothetical protein